MISNRLQEQGGPHITGDLTTSTASKALSLPPHNFLTSLLITSFGALWIIKNHPKIKMNINHECETKEGKTDEF